MEYGTVTELAQGLVMNFSSYDGGATVVLIIAESGCFNFQLVSNDNDIYLPIETTNEILSPNCFGESDVFEFENNDIDGDGLLNSEDDDIDGDGLFDEFGNCVSSCNDDDPDIDGDEECDYFECTGQITINIVEDEDYTADYTVFISSSI